MSYSGKKLLIIGGAYQHVKVVEAAKRLGVKTYVVDYTDREKAPAKLVADHDYKIDIFDTDSIVKLCRDNKIDGVLACNFDVCQKPYLEVCNKLGLPCFGNAEQFEQLTDKRKFKSLCRDNDVDVIPEYTEETIRNYEFNEFPIFIKPAESSSSYGQTICYKREEIDEAVKLAKSTSRNGEVVIERYMKDFPDFAIQGIVLGRRFHIIRIGDRFLGTGELNKSEVFGVYPSIYSGLYYTNVHSKIEKMLNKMGCKNCPVFLQGFVDGDTIRFYDPGLRFSGMEYELIYDKLFGINMSEECVKFALSGKFDDELDNIIDKARTTAFGALMYIPLYSGTIARIEGEEDIVSHINVVTMKKQYGVGDFVGTHNNAKQRLAEIDFICESIEEVQEMILWIFSKLKVWDAEGKDMVNRNFDVHRLDIYK